MAKVAVALKDLVIMIGSLRCEHVHHKPSEYHELGTTCPVVQRLLDTYAS